jgi:elongation factor Tu
VSGRVERGTLKIGDKVEIVGLDNEGAEVVVTGTQSFHKDVPEARAGMNVGLLLRGLRRNDVARGQVLSAPGAIKAHTKGKAQVFVLTKEEGGRHTPFASGYTPQFFFGVTDVPGTVLLDEGALVSPGDQAEIGFELMKPVGIEKGVRFAIREGGKTVGAGLVTDVVA